MSSDHFSPGPNPITSPRESGTSRPAPARQKTGSQPAAGTNFSTVLAGQQHLTAQRSSNPPPNRWRKLSFLTRQAAPGRAWPWTRSGLNPLLKVATPSPALSAPQLSATAPVTRPALSPAAPVLTETGITSIPPLVLNDYPHPPQDNGRGVHWIPTVSQSPQVVDRFVDEAVAMGMKWVLFLNDGTNIGGNDYLVQRLTQAGIEPVMRVYTPGLEPIQGNLKAAVQHYTKLGVRYFQLYNEPNLMVETGGQFPDVDHYLNLWVPAAQQVIEAGGLPGFGALSPQGEMDDRQFLRQGLERLKARGQIDILNRSWLAMHNYTGPRPLDDPDGFLRFQQYNDIIEAALGRSLPIIGTEGGTHISEYVSEEEQIAMVTGSYDYMRQREPYNFAYTYWIIANGHDPAWDQQALIRPDGPTALAEALKSMNL